MFSLFKKITFVWALIGLAFSVNAQSIYADQETNSTTATCLACSVTDPALAVDGDESTASTLTTNLSLLGGAVEQTLIFPVTGNLGDTVEIMLESSEALLDISLLGNVEVESFLGATANGDVKEAGITSVSVLGARKFLFTFNPGATYDRVSVKLNGGVLGLLGSLQIYYARIFHENPTTGLTSCNTPDSVSSTVNCPLLGLLLPLCEVDNPQAILTPNPNDYATIKLQADLTATGGIGASYNTPACATDSVSIILERPGSIINANLLGSSINFSTYLNGVQNSTEPLLAENLSVVSGASIYQYIFNPGVEFDSVSVDMNAGLLGLLTTLRVYNVCLLRKLPPMPDPVLGSSTRACYDGDLTINFQVPAGDNIRVYSERTRTTAPIYSGPSPFVATNLLMDTTFYVESFNPGIGCASESIDSIFIDVLDPVQPAIVEDLVVCYNTSARIAPLPAGSIFAFHADSNAAAVFTGGAFITDPIKNDTTFFIKNTIDNFCFEDFFQTINITLLEEPQIASTVDTIGICEGGTDDIPVFVTDESVTGVTITYSVYDRDTVLLTTFNFPDTAFIPRSAINATIAGDIDTLIVDATSGTCRESANKQTLIVKVVDPLSVATPQVDTTIVCGTDSAVVRINTTLRGFDYKWYTDSIGGTVAYTGDSIFVSGLTDTLRLYVEASFGACQSQTRGEAVIIPLSATNNNFTSLDRNICIGDSTLLIATNDAGFDITWYDAAEDGNIIVNSDSLQTTVLESDTIFYIDANSLNCASSTRFPVKVTRSAKPTIAVDKDQYYVCSGDDVALIANPSAGSTASWWTLSSAGTLISTDNPLNFDSSALPANSSFTLFVQADNDMCPSLARVAVTVSNVDGSAQPFISATTPICKGENAMLVASSPNVEDVEYTWWTASSGGVELSRGDIYNTGEIQNDVTIYAQIEFGDSVCMDAGRRAQLIETLPVLDTPGNVRCTNTEGNSVSFAWDPVSGATEYEYDFTIEDGASGVLRTTATTLDFTGLADGTTVTILVRAIGLPTLDCQTSEPGYASCTAGCPINNSRLNQLEYEICQNEQVEIIIELDQTMDPTVLANLQIGILGQPGTSQNLRYIYPDDFANTPDLSNPLGTSVIDSIHFYIAYPSEEGCDSLIIPTRVVINTIPDIDPVNAIQVVALVPATVGQIVDEFQFSSNVPGGLDLLWDFGDGQTSTELNPTHKFAVSETPYRVTLSVTNSFGCASTVTYFRDIVVTSVPDVFIPNTFTPNGDGKNDGFRIFGEGITLDKFQIFNVYGNVVFESEDITEMWDGEYNGKPVQGGTYYYTATIKDFIGLSYEKEGSFTVIRK